MRCVFGAALLSICALVQAQYEAGGVRLSAHLKNAARELVENPDGLGLVWTTPEERLRQQVVYQQLLLQLANIH